MSIWAPSINLIEFINLSHSCSYLWKITICGDVNMVILLFFGENVCLKAYNIAHELFYLIF